MSMISRKYYAQRGHSGGQMNTLPVSGSGYTSLKNRKNTLAFGNYYGPVQNLNTSSLHTQIISQNASGCVKSVPYAENNAVSTSCYKRPGIGNIINTSRKVCYTHKEWPVITSSQQVILERESRSCPANDPVVVNNSCYTDRKEK